MEALWNLEDKWKLSTEEAVLLFGCTAIAVVGLCATTTMLKKKIIRWKKLVDEEPGAVDDANMNWSESGSSSYTIKRVLMGSARWSGVSKWEEDAPPLLGGGWCEEGVGWQSPSSMSPVWQRPILMGERCKEDVGWLSHNSVSPAWRSHNSVSPVWQRPILMGEKCELPRFSGLILYDERGRPLQQSGEALQEKPAAIVTLKDLF